MVHLALRRMTDSSGGGMWGSRRTEFSMGTTHAYTIELDPPVVSFLSHYLLEPFRCKVSSRLALFLWQLRSNSSNLVNLT